jgi:hypothetical protein
MPKFLRLSKMYVNVLEIQSYEPALAKKAGATVRRGKGVLYLAGEIKVALDEAEAALVEAFISANLVP